MGQSVENRRCSSGYSTIRISMLLALIFSVACSAESEESSELAGNEDVFGSADLGPDLTECPDAFLMSDNGVCIDIDECAEDNGGCGDPSVFDCVNNEGAAPTCVYDPLEDYLALTNGVTTIDSGGAYPSPLIVHGETAFPVALDENSLCLVAAARSGDGRVVAYGNETHLDGALYNTGDSDQLLKNAVVWSSGIETPVVGIEGSLGGLLTFLAEAGMTVRAITPELLYTVDVYVTTGYPEYSDEQFEIVQEFVANGGGLVVAGQAWWWGYSHTDTSLSYPGNRMMMEAGVTITSDWDISGGVVEVGERPPSVLFHALGALNMMVEHLDGERILDHSEQVDGATTIGRAITALALEFEYFDRAMVFLDVLAEPLIPTEEAPILPNEQPVEQIVARLESKLASELPVEEVFPIAAAESFPGTVSSDEERVTESFVFQADYEGRNPLYVYSNPESPRWHSTGLYAPAGEEILVTLYTGQTGQGLDILIGSHTDTLWATDSWSRYPDITRAFPLDEEVTRAVSGFGGLIYFRVPPGSELGEAELMIQNAVRAPWYQHGLTTLEAWEEIRDYPGPRAEFQSDKFILTVPSDVIRDLDNPDELMDFWDSVLDADADLASISRDRVRPERFVTDRQISVGWMHSGYPLMAHDVSAPDLTNLEHILENGDWGAFHELGHNHQFDPWILPGTTEASVNLWSVYNYEEVLGIPRDNGSHSAISNEEREARILGYLEGGADFYADWSVWTALETYLQLQEAFGWDLYVELFGEYLSLTGSDIPNTDQERIDEWVVRTSNAVELNLVPFYEAWGFPFSSWVETEVEDWPEWEDHPMEAYLD